MSIKIKQALNDPDNKANSFKKPEQALSRLLWKIIRDRCISHQGWARCMRNYVSNPQFVVQTNKRRQGTPSNLNNAILGDERPLSFKKFLNAIRMLGYCKMEVKITLWRPNREEGQVNSMTFNIDDSDSTPIEEDEGE